MFTGNPVLDAEEYYDELERAQEHREFKECGHCHGPIYKADDYYDGTRYCPVDDMWICEECIGPYIRKKMKEYV